MGEIIIRRLSRCGWRAEVSKAVCVEIQPGCNVVERFNIALSQGTDMLPTVEADKLRYSSLSRSHAKACLRRVLARAPSTDPATSRDGRLDLVCVCVCVCLCVCVLCQCVSVSAADGGFPADT